MTGSPTTNARGVYSLEILDNPFSLIGRSCKTTRDLAAGCPLCFLVALISAYTQFALGLSEGETRTAESASGALFAHLKVSTLY